MEISSLNSWDVKEHISKHLPEPISVFHTVFTRSNILINDEISDDSLFGVEKMSDTR